MKLKEKVYDLCKRIPHGKISTYGIIAEKLNTKAYRAVGQALKYNEHPKEIPCFKIVKSNGEIGGYSGNKQDNINKKIKLLEKEGIIIKNNKIMNFDEVLHKF